MRPTPAPADSRPSPLLKSTRRTKKFSAIRRENVLAAMSPRSPTTSLEPFLGTYRIVWDSESNWDPRHTIVDPAAERDPEDGLLVLTRPQRAQGWPREHAPSSSVVLRFCDSFLGADHTASVLKPSLHPTPTRVASDSDSPPPSDPSLLSPLSAASPSRSPSSSSRSPSSASSLRSLPRAPSTSSGNSTTPGPPRFWHFAWDPSFPRLGFRHEGMDLTAPHGHALSFARVRDDRGAPFAVLDLAGAGVGAGGGDGCITVVAKRVPDRWAREGLSRGERERLGMVELDEEGRPFDYY
ncbi:hypothetical protein TRAPUB_3605 [Trametes pubescens]|uniref:Uncharacterized protein n=1 Tax=Trametes pubescens TaxID=154538 RepID=A0A1M2VDB3_TRAPU|nr:hypothetical protein TRAPUB_3605 [Trametes pubescens]